MDVEKAIMLFLHEQLGFDQNEINSELCLFSTSLLTSLDAYNLINFVVEQAGAKLKTSLSLSRHDKISDIVNLFDTKLYI